MQAASLRVTETALLQDFLDGPGRDRTCDLGIKSPLLYQLSYRPAILRLWGKVTQKVLRSRSGSLRSSGATTDSSGSTPERAAVYASTDEEPERHFVGWADEVDPDELFASGRAWGIQVVRRKL